MKSITIHNLDDSLNKLIREKSRKSGMSLNKTIQMLLRQALGLKNKPGKDHKGDFVDIFGQWTKKDENEFNKNIKNFNEINETDWK